MFVFRLLTEADLTEGLRREVKAPARASHEAEGSGPNFNLF